VRRPLCSIVKESRLTHFDPSLCQVCQCHAASDPSPEPQPLLPLPAVVPALGGALPLAYPDRHPRPHNHVQPGAARQADRGLGRGLRDAHTRVRPKFRGSPPGTLAHADRVRSSPPTRQIPPAATADDPADAARPHLAAGQEPGRQLDCSGPSTSLLTPPASSLRRS